MLKRNKLALATGLALLTGAANAGYTIKISDQDSITFGGYVKVDARYIDGDVPATEYWYGGGSKGEDTENFAITANETRFNTKYVHGDVTAFIEMDFYGEAVRGGGNEAISNSSKPRLRHAFIKYENLLIGQTWSTFVNTGALAETADFGGPLNSVAFIRQGQIRYTNGGLQLAIENPETYTENGLTGNDTAPDLIGKYTFSDDWGSISIAAVARQLQTSDDDEEAALGFGISGKIKTFGKDDLRFQVHGGEVGRYVGVTASRDLIADEVEETTSVMVAYRHFWNDDIRSTVFYGNTTTEESDVDRTHVGVNLFKNYTKELAFGVEIGNYELANQDADSNYLHFTAKYVL
ncbi:DcaP family trimeric outer membrane transporter [Thalassomonas sp. M1454]|uniref:DcaP family trimeric outer membrane transporter n=1 Tax=Thalassomonas sp. M1454 TaxID=2594477 RepID=UPI00117D529F|nr:DcaP family trimeric outer membrane transporter [Thalassomonas sp. M1454]TRX58079.1 hypothetical protein FNN08_01445 [Thalassomonas sp. M1454]